MTEPGLYVIIRHLKVDAAYKYWECVIDGNFCAYETGFSTQDVYLLTVCES